MRIAVAVIATGLLAGGCRIGFDEKLIEADADAGTDCWAAWRAGTVSLTDPAPIPAVVSDEDEGNPYLAPDLRTLYFGRGGGDSRDVYVATRADRGAPFGAAVEVAAINSSDDEGRLGLSADGATAVFSSERPGTSGGGPDIWTAPRTGTLELGPPTQAGLDAVNTPVQELDPELAADGLALYLAPFTGGTQHIAVARRTAIGQPFGAPVRLTELDVTTGVADPALSPDQLVIVFAAGGDAPANDLYYATRSDADEAFVNPRLVPGVNSAVNDGDTAISVDGCELLFSSSRGGDRDLYVATVVP
jgi:hypothetical protein